MATDLATYYVNVVPSTKGIGGQLINEFDQAGGSAGNSFISKFKKIVATAGIGAMLTNIVKQGLDLGGALEQSMGGVRAILGDAALEQVKIFANSAAKDLQISANTYMEQVTSFSARLLQGLEGDTEATVKYADMAIRDMSDNANMMGTSIESIQNAYQGFAKNNFTMLDNLKLGYGGTQSEMIRLINDSGILGETISSLDGITFDQMIAAIHQVQDNMGITGKSAEEAKETISGSLKSVKAAWENFLANMTLGEDVQPALDDLKITFENAMNQIAPAVINILTTIGPAFIDVMMASAPQFIDAAGTVISTFINGLAQSAPQLVPQIVNLVLLITKTILNNLPQVLYAGLQIVGGLVIGIGNAAGQLLTKIGSVISNAIQGVKNTLSQWVSAGGQLLNGLAQGIGNAVGSVISKVKGYVGNIISSVKKFFGIHSPSRVFAEIGEMNMLGLAQGIEDNLKPVTEAMDEAARIASSDFESQVSVGSVGGLNDLVGANSTTNYGGVAINVYATDGQSARSIAEEVMNIMQNEVTSQRLVFR